MPFEKGRSTSSASLPSTTVAYAQRRKKSPCEPYQPLRPGINPSANVGSNVTARLLPRRFGFDASDEQLVVNKAVEEVVPFLG
jgi:hypothetical protein